MIVETLLWHQLSRIERDIAELKLEHPEHRDGLDELLSKLNDLKSNAPIDAQV